MTALPLASPRPARSTTPRPHLEVAPRPSRRARPKLLPAVVTIAGIGAILLAQLLLSIVLADGAYTIAELQAEQRDLSREEQALTEDLEVLASTQYLVSSAENLGMVASGNPVFLDVSTGAVSGTPTSAGGSLTGASGNQVGNALLAGTTPVEPAASDTTTGSGASNSTGGSSASGGSSTSAPSSPGTIPSPTTR